MGIYTGEKQTINIKYLGMGYGSATPGHILRINSWEMMVVSQDKTSVGFCNAGDWQQKWPTTDLPPVL